MNRFVSGAKLQDKPGYTAMKFDPFGGARLQIDPENERTAVANVRSLRAAVAPRPHARLPRQRRGRAFPEHPGAGRRGGRAGDLQGDGAPAPASLLTRERRPEGDAWVSIKCIALIIGLHLAASNRPAWRAVGALLR